jgi:hypothetical protein
MGQIKDVVCAHCEKPGSFELTEGGFYPDPIPGWYWSDNDQCFYCKPCERMLVSELFQDLLDLCKENRIPVKDLHGNTVQE